VQGHDIEFDRIGRQFDQCIGDLEREALLAKAAGKNDDIVGGYDISFLTRALGRLGRYPNGVNERCKCMNFLSRPLRIIPGAVERPERLHPGGTKWLTSQITADDDPTSQTFASGDWITGFQAAGTSRYFSPCSD
jgi:hypothetical protein